jgi:glyoxylase-like metal-dependent hydrolase (beta-lactamase superfamily II)
MTMEQWRIGSVEITKVPELVLPIPLEGLLPDATADDVHRHGWLRRGFVNDDGRALLSFHALVVETGERTILVDTCIGNDRRTLSELPPMHTQFLDDLAAAGYPRERIDTVVCTHLHFDHVGWHTMLVDGRWTVTFTQARHLVGRDEWEHWRSTQSELTNLGDTLQPVLDAELVDLVPADHQICEEVRLEPTPGHTPGHVSVRISSEGQEAVITGDVVHHPVQFAEPGLRGASDSNPDLARSTRRRFAECYGETSTMVIGTHFAAPTAGKLVRDGHGWRLEC